MGASEGRRSDRDMRGEGPRKGEESLENLLRPEEKELVRQLVQDLRSIRYGSIVLTMHEGRLVEVSKTIRVRKSQRSDSERESEEKI